MVSLRHVNYLAHLALSTQRELIGFSVLFLARTPLPCLARIQTINVRCCGLPGRRNRSHLPQGPQWKKMWHGIAKLGSLKQLRVEVCGAQVPSGWRKEVLTPMVDAAAKGNLVSLKSWVVEVPWRQFIVDQEVAKGLPFELVTLLLS